MNTKKMGRRTLLGLGMATAAKLLVGCTDRSLPENTPTPSVMPSTNPSGQLPHTLQVLAPAPSVVKTFENVFVMTTLTKVANITGSTGESLLALIMTGKSNQLQIIDPTNGKIERVVDIAGNLDARTLVWDPKTRNLYVGTSQGLLYQYAYDADKLVVLGRAATKATSLYSLDIDSTGRVWGGSYPDGIVWNYTPASGEFEQLPPIDSNTDYVRSLAITEDDTVYVGTGPVSPKVFRFHADSPSEQIALALPTLPQTGFIRSISVAGDLVLISADTLSNQLIWNHRTKILATARLPKAQNQSARSPSSRTIYWVSGGALYSTDTSTGADTLRGDLGLKYPEHIWSIPGVVFILTRKGNQAITHKFDLQTSAVTTQSTTVLKGVGVGVHSLFAHKDGRIYIGGYQGHGVATLNPETGERWQSLDSVAPNQITGMLQWSSSKTYVGSYGSGDIIRFVTPRKDEGRIAFKLLTRLHTEYGQSRPIGWAKNKTHVFFGTVPDYGLTGGALGIINPADDTIEDVYNTLIPGHSIIGLVASQKFVYGTTSVRNGYGLPDTEGNAKIFAFDLTKRELAWSREVPGFKAVMTPLLLDDRIVAATIEGIIILDSSDGVLLKSHSFTGRHERRSRPGWSNASIQQLTGNNRLVHVTAGRINIVDLVRSTVQLVENNLESGTAMTVGSDDRLYVSNNVLGIAEITLDQSNEVRPIIEGNPEH